MRERERERERREEKKGKEGEREGERESDCVIGVVQRVVFLRLSHYGRIITGSCVFCEYTLLTEEHLQWGTLFTMRYELRLNKYLSTKHVIQQRMVCVRC